MDYLQQIILVFSNYREDNGEKTTELQMFFHN